MIYCLEYLYTFAQQKEYTMKPSENIGYLSFFARFSYTINFRGFFPKNSCYVRGCVIVGSESFIGMSTIYVMCIIINYNIKIYICGDVSESGWQK